MSKCKNCGYENKDIAEFCIECGSPLNQSEKTCPHCGMQNRKTAIYCIECGKKIEDDSIHVSEDIKQIDSAYNESDEEIEAVSKVVRKDSHEPIGEVPKETVEETVTEETTTETVTEETTTETTTETVTEETTTEAIAEESGNICSKCGHENPKDSKFCNICGNKLGVSENICPNCGKKNPKDSSFCNSCGTNLKDNHFIFCQLCGTKNEYNNFRCTNCNQILLK